MIMMTNTRKCLYARIKKVKKPSVFIYRRWRMRLAIARKKLRKFRIPAADNMALSCTLQVAHTYSHTTKNIIEIIKIYLRWATITVNYGYRNTKIIIPILCNKFEKISLWNRLNQNINIEWSLLLHYSLFSLIIIVIDVSEYDCLVGLVVSVVCRARLAA